MIEIARSRKLVRIRDVERKLAALSLADATRQVTDSDARIARLRQLSSAVVMHTGLHSGATLTSASECVSRLLGGSIMLSVHRGRQAEQAQSAQHMFEIADARTSIARRHAVAGDLASAKASDLRATLKMPVRGALKCN